MLKGLANACCQSDAYSIYLSSIAVSNPDAAKFVTLNVVGV